jgi:hypothetical protein
MSYNSDVPNDCMPSPCRISTSEFTGVHDAHDMPAVAVEWLTHCPLKPPSPPCIDYGRWNEEALMLHGEYHTVYHKLNRKTNPGVGILIGVAGSMTAAFMQLSAHRR